MKYLSFVAGFLLLSGLSLAADIDGKWSGEIVGQSMEIAFTFQAEGTTLTGVHIVNGQETPIKDGKIDGKNISFTVTLDLGLESEWTSLPEVRLVNLVFNGNEMWVPRHGTQDYGGAGGTSASGPVVAGR